MTNNTPTPNYLLDDANRTLKKRMDKALTPTPFKQKWTKRFSKIIRNTRKELDESGTVFGRRFGVSHSAVSDWERGVSEAPYKVIGFCLSFDSIYKPPPTPFDWRSELSKKHILLGFASENIHYNQEITVTSLLSNEFIVELLEKVEAATEERVRGEIDDQLNKGCFIESRKLVDQKLTEIVIRNAKVDPDILARQYVSAILDSLVMKVFDVIKEERQKLELLGEKGE